MPCISCPGILNGLNDIFQTDADSLFKGSHFVSQTAFPQNMSTSIIYIVLEYVSPWNIHCPEYACCEISLVLENPLPLNMPCPSTLSCPGICLALD